MATRLYFGNLDVVGSVYSPDPGFSERGTWSDTSRTQCYLAPAGHASLAAYTGVVRNFVTVASTAQIIRCQAISPPLAAGYTWTADTFTFVSRRAQSIDANTFDQYYVGILSNDGTILRAITALEKDGTDHAISTTAASKTNAMIAGKLTYTSVAGDRLFIEFGDDKDSAIASDLRVAFLYSTTSGDLSSIEGDVSVQNLWLETSLNITFDVEGTSYGTNKRLMMMGCGS